ncbi:MAG: prolipoprotein diacylglyceryl transferase [Chloroflexi bacterium]|nr:prolipoprotein diacylglyceryl transferase [Chloroflexota bacterium]
MLDLVALIDIKPGPNVIEWPIPIGWYGVGYAIAIATGTWVAQREMHRRGLDPRVILDGLLLTVVLGLIGARLYHVIDQWHVYSQDLAKIVLPPYSGLGLYGGVAGGILGIAIYLRRRGFPVLPVLDVGAVGFLVGQAIARWGNFFNQELYGGPTSAPWGIAIDCAHRVTRYACEQFPEATTGFHPLFFYESALTLSGALIALLLFRRYSHRLRDGDIFAFWFIWYGTVRALLETFREGYNWTLGGIPVAILIGVAAVLFGTGFLVWNHRRPGASRAARIALAEAERAVAGRPPPDGNAGDSTPIAADHGGDVIDRPAQPSTRSDPEQA